MVTISSSNHLAVHRQLASAEAHAMVVCVRENSIAGCFDKNAALMVGISRQPNFGYLCG